MLIREWMNRDVLTVSPETSMFKAAKIMKSHDIRRLPVVDAENKLIGIVSDRDIKAASPSRATTLDAHELSYLLSELKIRDIMTRDPVTVRETDTIESAALILEKKNFGGLPVIDDNRHVLGIITDHDIFRVLVDVSGAKVRGLKLALKLPDEPGAMRPVFDLLFDQQANICTILASRQNAQGNTSHVYIRLHPMPKEKEKALIEAIRDKLPLEYWFDEHLHDIQ